MFQEWRALIENQGDATIEARRRTVSLYSCGYSVSSTIQQLEQEKVTVSKHAIYDLVRKFCLKGVAC